MSEDESVRRQLVVQGHLFKQSGKWKYEVWLDYRGILYPDGLPCKQNYLDPGQAALEAFRQATEKGISGVTLTSPGCLHLVVFEPPHGWPIMVVSTEEQE